MFFILDIFCPFNPLPPSNDSKSQNFRKKWKKCLEISSLYTSVPKLMIIGYTALEIWCMMNVIVFHFGQFFATPLPPPPPPLPLKQRKKWKFQKKWKKHLKISSFYTILPNLMIICYTVLEIWCMDIILFHLELFLPFYCDVGSFL